MNIGSRVVRGVMATVGAAAAEAALLSSSPFATQAQNVENATVSILAV